ncbi:hypothetical protein CRX22_10590 [Salmonella enterica subsp. enterica serovar Newport]|nr:hypothetical protein [Salmonella enterica subsp. enterica serovar Newport]
MSRTRHRSKGWGGMSPGVKDAQNRHSRMDERKLAGLTLDECLSYQTYNIDGEYYDGEILEEPKKILDLGNDKKYKRQANEGFQYS